MGNNEREYFIDRPEQIKVSLTNICNYRCIMCYNPTLKQPRGYIEDRLMYSILEQCQELGVKKISLGAVGEPLLHKNFLAYVRAAKSMGFWVSTTSNCSLLDREKAHALVEAGLDRFLISMYSTTSQEHRQYSGTDTFAQTAENIKYFLNLYKTQSRKMEISMFYLALPGGTDFNAHQKYWGPILKEAGLEVVKKTEINWAGEVNLYNPRRFYFEKNPGSPQALVVKRKVRCPHVRYYVLILHDGTVLPCCNIPWDEGKADINFGNVNQQKIINIWQSPKYLEFKRRHSQKDNNFSFCRECSDVYKTYRLELSWNGLVEVGVKVKNKLSKFRPPADSSK